MREQEFLNDIDKRFNHIFKDGNDALDIARHTLMILASELTEVHVNANFLHHAINYLDTYEFKESRK